MTGRVVTTSLLLLWVVSLAGCTGLLRRLQYDNLDQVAVDATGKQLWEIEFGDKEIRQVRATLDKTMTASLYCIRDNAGAQVDVPDGLSRAQADLRVDNIALLIDRALLPAIKLRESEAERQVLRSGCNHR